MLMDMHMPHAPTVTMQCVSHTQGVVRVMVRYARVRDMARARVTVDLYMIMMCSGWLHAQCHVHLQGREVRHKAVTQRVTQRKGQMQVK